MYFKQNSAIESIDRKVLNCYIVLEFSFEVSIIDQEVYL